ncbi:C2 domain [Dillenia turbinata]|uniref:C2 domain n=1 Tax=Dillenia turbinata TaxID=194707 RepID=A0AAN8URK6_9MAGN
MKLTQTHFQQEEHCLLFCKDPVICPLAEQDLDDIQRLVPEIPLWMKNPDIDRYLDWLNKFIKYMWPHLDKAICKTAKNITTPIIAEQIPKYKIESVEFEALTLGTLPPTFQGVDYGAISLVGWDPNVFVAVKAFGLKATAQVVDLQVFAAPRITLKPLVPTFPCFAKILVSLMEKDWRISLVNSGKICDVCYILVHLPPLLTTNIDPILKLNPGSLKWIVDNQSSNLVKPHVDFGLKLVGADLISIPGLYRFVQEIIKDQVANMYLWPKTLEVPIMDPAQFSCHLHGYLNGDTQSPTDASWDSECEGCGGNETEEEGFAGEEGHCEAQNLNPEWNEEFNLRVKHPESQALEFRVYDWEQVGKHDKMGMNVVPLEELPHEEPKVFTLELLKNLNPNDAQNDKSCGQIVLELAYKPFKEEDMPQDPEVPNSVAMAPNGTPDGEGLLVVIGHEAQALEGKHHTNPSARILFRSEESRTKESLGYVDISLSDVVTNKRINEKNHLIDSKNGRIQLQWRTSSTFLTLFFF